MRSDKEINARIEKIRKDIYAYALCWPPRYIRDLKVEVRTLQWVLKKRQDSLKDNN